MITIKEVCERCGISADTLRYYERVGVVPPVGRTKGGIRFYTDEDISWVENAICMRRAGLSVEMLSEYVRLFQKGDSSIPARRTLLMEAREEINSQLKKYQETMDKLNYKISLYDEAMRTGVLRWNMSKKRRDFQMEFMTLNNGQKCPVIGIGTFLIKPVDAENSVREALKMGYSCIDTAAAYCNERAVGRGMKSSGVARENIFLSTKIWPSDYENQNAVNETLERLDTDYVDLLYIHQPAGNWMSGYRMLEKAYRDGKAKSIGISNFEGEFIEELEKKWEIVPQFMQVEAHPYFTQDKLRTKLDEFGIKLMSWFPLGQGDKALIGETIFEELGKKYNKTSAQVILRWHTQMGFAVIPGSKNIDHIRDNLNILDFKLTDEEMAEISKLNKGTRYYNRTDEQLEKFVLWHPEFETK
ncbi:2,5-diketo-D-gluconic acid reductase [Candidatus Arthromitus sp. SFB-mouse-NL]|uniref:aldo/keto reductase n=1 Tax=Candidatus Arthromitus sp. SFB-mouse-NL TaxID=1508644 RepID=UPI00049B4F67|nr:2,5-diketo-D-gluconic acid reductase [Candidatus Arthromitus sp. SFB-mouse-NL]